MPASWVADEAKWEKAEQLAEKQGRGKDYAYITGIYKQMGGRKKAAMKGRVSLSTRLVTPESGDDLLAKGWVELPEDAGSELWETVAKGKGHKYIKRVPYTKKNGKRGYRYFYKVSHGRGVAHADHFVEGASFQHEGGHYHITKVSGGRVSVRHDETGETREMTRDELKAMLSAHHAGAIKEHHARLVQEHADALKYGSAKQQAAAKKRAESAGVKLAVDDRVQPKDIELSYGWDHRAAGSRSHPVKVGEIRKTKGQGLVVVTGVSSRYIREDGLSVGLGQDSGWLHTASARPVTAEEEIHYKKSHAPYEEAVENHREMTKALEDAADALRSMQPKGSGVEGPDLPTDKAERVGSTWEFKDVKQLIVKRGDTHVHLLHGGFDDMRVGSIRRTPKVNAAVDAFVAAVERAKESKASLKKTQRPGKVMSPNPVATKPQKAAPSKTASSDQLKSARFYRNKYAGRSSSGEHVEAGKGYTRKEHGQYVVYTEAEAHASALRVHEARGAQSEQAAAAAGDPDNHPHLRKIGNEWHVTHHNTWGLKDKIKQTGAKWDRHYRRWYAPSKAIAEKLTHVLKGMDMRVNLSTRLMGVNGLLAKGWIELPEAYADELWKGAGHKYIKRVPYTDSKGKRRYRYFYKVQHGRGIGNKEHMVVGAAFQMEGGHYHITAEHDDGTVTVVHDETGKKKRVSRGTLKEALRAHHDEAIDKYQAKVKQEYRDAMEHGTDAQKVAAWKRARRAGVKVPRPSEVARQKDLTEQARVRGIRNRYERVKRRHAKDQASDAELAEARSALEEATGTKIKPMPSEAKDPAKPAAEQPEEKISRADRFMRDQAAKQAKRHEAKHQEAQAEATRETDPGKRAKKQAEADMWAARMRSSQAKAEGKDASGHDRAAREAKKRAESEPEERPAPSPAVGLLAGIPAKIQGVVAPYKDRVEGHRFIPLSELGDRRDMARGRFSPRVSRAINEAGYAMVKEGSEAKPAAAADFKVKKVKTHEREGARIVSKQGATLYTFDGKAWRDADNIKTARSRVEHDLGRFEGEFALGVVPGRGEVVKRKRKAAAKPSAKPKPRREAPAESASTEELHRRADEAHAQAEKLAEQSRRTHGSTRTKRGLQRIDRSVRLASQATKKYQEAKRLREQAAKKPTAASSWPEHGPGQAPKRIDLASAKVIGDHKGGHKFVVLPTDRSKRSPGEDKWQMLAVDKDGTVVKNYGTHLSDDGAASWFNNRPELHDQPTKDAGDRPDPAPIQAARQLRHTVKHPETGSARGRSHVAKISGLHAKYGLDREFLDASGTAASAKYHRSSGDYARGHHFSLGPGLYEEKEMGEVSHFAVVSRGDALEKEWLEEPQARRLAKKLHGQPESEHKTIIESHFKKSGPDADLFKAYLEQSGGRWLVKDGPLGRVVGSSKSKREAERLLERHRRKKAMKKKGTYTPIRGLRAAVKAEDKTSTANGVDLYDDILHGDRVSKADPGLVELYDEVHKASEIDTAVVDAKIRDAIRWGDGDLGDEEQQAQAICDKVVCDLALGYKADDKSSGIIRSYVADYGVDGLMARVRSLMKTTERRPEPGGPETVAEAPKPIAPHPFVGHMMSANGMPLA
jgi:hypothetical protein